MPLVAARRAVRESVSGLPREFWWLWTSTLVNRLGAFVATFMALYLTLDRGYSASYAGLVASLHGLGGVVSSLGGSVMADRLGRRPTLLDGVRPGEAAATAGFYDRAHPTRHFRRWVGVTPGRYWPLSERSATSRVR